MSQNVPFVLVGNSLAVMVAATNLAKNGVDVVIVNGSSNWGGHFSTVSCGGLSYDVGMVLYEFTSYNATDKEDILSYNPAIRNDSGRFCKTVRHYVNRYQETHEIATLKMYVEGRYYDDLLLANSLSSLEYLPFAQTVKNELITLLTKQPPSPLHASYKNSSDDFKYLDYQSVSLANHGSTLHTQLIEPFCRKMLYTSSDEVLALYHRVPWLPLFYPETLLSYLQGTPQQLPPTIFNYPNNGECVSDLATKLKAEIQNNKHITVIPEHPHKLTVINQEKYEIIFLNREKILTNHLSWSNNLGDLLRVLGLESSIRQYEKCSVALAFLRIPTKALKFDFTVISVVEPNIMTYRVFNQSYCSGENSEFSRLVVELNIDYIAAHKSNAAQLDLRHLVVEELMLLDIVTDGACIECMDIKEIKNALMLPNRSNQNFFEEETQTVLEVVPMVSLLGPASGFFSSSLNNQIIQGLKLNALWGHLS